MIGGIGYGVHGMGSMYASSMDGVSGSAMRTGAVTGTPLSAGTPNSESVAKEEGLSQAQIRSMKRSGAIECEACKNRKYQDGSDESDVSFKSPGHIDPSSSGAKVMAHEQQHVSNAYEKAAKGNGKVMNASVSIKTAVCPECGRSYVAGGQTRTMIKYNEDNPYGKAAKSVDAANLLGKNIDYAV